MKQWKLHETSQGKAVNINLSFIFDSTPVTFAVQVIPYFDEIKILGNVQILPISKQGAFTFSAHVSHIAAEMAHPFLAESLKPYLSSQLNIYMRHYMRHIKWFVLKHDAFETNHLRRLVHIKTLTKV